MWASLAFVSAPHDHSAMKSFLIACLLCVAACDDAAVNVNPDTQGGATVDGAAASDAATTGCNPRITKHADQGGVHIAEAAYDPAVYNSNPPSSGPHCGVWGAYTTFDAKPLPRCNYIHNLEHGAVVLLHNCADGCNDVKAAFASLVESFQGERSCPSKRFVITPDRDLATKVAAAAWGWTFTADCLDADALTVLATFADDHYNKAPEDVCSGGFSP